MKICFFTENYYKGGLDTFLINLVNVWPDSTDELILVCNNTHPGLNTILEKTRHKIKIKTYSGIFFSSLLQRQSNAEWSHFFPVRIFSALAFRLLNYPILFPWYLVTTMLFFWRNDFDRLMVVNGGYPGSLIGRSALLAWRLLKKKPLAVMNFHNSAIRPPWYFSFFENFIDAQVIKSASHIVSVSKDCLQSLNNRSAFLRCNKLLYIYNGIEDPVRSSLVYSPVVRNKLSHKRYCLMLATYEARKGHAYILKVFQVLLKDLPDIQLKIYGYGLPHEKKLVADEVKRLKLDNNVILGDFTSDISLLISKASILVVPSQAFESFGLTIVESMAFGVPVVITNVGGMPEVLGASKAGYVCSKDDPLEFANAIKNILGNSSLAHEMSRNGRLAFEARFMARTMAMQYAAIIKN